jgi:hypothetical protein
MRNMIPDVYHVYMRVSRMKRQRTKDHNVSQNV